MDRRRVTPSRHRSSATWMASQEVRALSLPFLRQPRPSKKGTPSSTEVPPRRWAACMPSKLFFDATSNQAKHGDARLSEVDQDNQPLFGFGNSTEGPLSQHMQSRSDSRRPQWTGPDPHFEPRCGTNPLQHRCAQDLGSHCGLPLRPPRLDGRQRQEDHPASPLLYRPSADFAGTRPFS